MLPLTEQVSVICSLILYWCLCSDWPFTVEDVVQPVSDKSLPSVGTLMPFFLFLIFLDSNFYLETFGC